MKKVVFIVTSGVDYSRDNVSGVFHSYSTALEFAKSIKLSSFYSTKDEECHLVEDDHCKDWAKENGYMHYFQDKKNYIHVHIERHEVQ